MCFTLKSSLLVLALELSRSLLFVKDANLTRARQQYFSDLTNLGSRGSTPFPYQSHPIEPINRTSTASLLIKACRHDSCGSTSTALSFLYVRTTSGDTQASGS